MPRGAWMAPSGENSATFRPGIEGCIHPLRHSATSRPRRRSFVPARGALAELAFDPSSGASRRCLLPDLKSEPPMSPPRREATLLTHAGNDPAASSGAVNPPVIRASTIVFPTVAAMEHASAHPFDAWY